MGYTTEFTGSFTLDSSLTDAQANYLNQFAATRRMKRDARVAAAMPDPPRLAVGLPIGDQAGYFVGAEGTHGDDEDASVIDYNRPPNGQPGLWCHWIVNPKDDGYAVPDANQSIGWSGTEKFYDYVTWLRYIIDHFLKPWGRTLNGQVDWQGEEPEDHGMIIVSNNVVATKTHYHKRGAR